MEGNAHQRSLREGRGSSAGEWYAITTCAVIADIRPASPCILDEARRLDTERAIALRAAVVMPDHVHLLLSLEDEVSVSAVVRLFKGRSSRRANILLGRSGPFWQRAFYDRRVGDPKEAYALWGYLLENPVRRGLVADWRDYPHTFTIPFNV